MRFSYSFSNGFALGIALCFLFIGVGNVAKAQGDPGTLTLERIFSSNEFQSERFGPARWLEDGSGYTTLEAFAHEVGGREIIKRYEKYKDSGVEWMGEIPEGWKLRC